MQGTGAGAGAAGVPVGVRTSSRPSPPAGLYNISSIDDNMVNWAPAAVVVTATDRSRPF
ncbi:MAG: hypothetical protein QOI83_272, partial [Streptomycetaceae bacterium]|nr:hypothetical protein [Streptomycetaceae bacterium]